MIYSFADTPKREGCVNHMTRRQIDSKKPAKLRLIMAIGVLTLGWNTGAWAGGYSDKIGDIQASMDTLDEEYQDANAAVKSFTEQLRANEKAEKDALRGRNPNIANECHQNCVTACAYQIAQTWDVTVAAAAPATGSGTPSPVTPPVASNPAPNALICVKIYEIFDGQLAELPAEASGASTASQCQRNVLNCPILKYRFAKEEAKSNLDEARKKRETISAQFARLQARKEAAYRACPNCAMMETMREVSKPTGGEIFLGALQTLAPAVLGGYQSYMQAKSIRSITGMYKDYVDANVKLGLPFQSPFANEGYGGYGNGYTGGGFYGGGNFPGMGYGTPGVPGVFGQNGYGIPGYGGYPGMGYPGGMGGMPGYGMGYPGGMGGMPGYGMPGYGANPYGGMGYPGGGVDLTAGFGITAMPFGIGFNSAMFPNGPIGAGINFGANLQGGFAPMTYNPMGVQSWYGAQPLAQYQDSSLAMQQQYFEALQRQNMSYQGMTNPYMPFGLGFGIPNAGMGRVF